MISRTTIKTYRDLCRVTQKKACRNCIRGARAFREAAKREQRRIC